MTDSCTQQIELITNKRKNQRQYPLKNYIMILRILTSHYPYSLYCVRSKMLTWSHSQTIYLIYLWLLLSAFHVVTTFPMLEQYLFTFMTNVIGYLRILSTMECSLTVDEIYLHNLVYPLCLHSCIYNCIVPPTEAIVGGVIGGIAFIISIIFAIIVILSIWPKCRKKQRQG